MLRHLLLLLAALEALSLRVGGGWRVGAISRRFAPPTLRQRPTTQHIRRELAALGVSSEGIFEKQQLYELLDKARVAASESGGGAAATPPSSPPPPPPSTAAASEPSSTAAASEPSLASMHIQEPTRPLFPICRTPFPPYVRN